MVDQLDFSLEVDVKAVYEKATVYWCMKTALSIPEEVGEKLWS